MFLGYESPKLAPPRPRLGVASFSDQINAIGHLHDYQDGITDDPDPAGAEAPKHEEFSMDACAEYFERRGYTSAQAFDYARMHTELGINHSQLFSVMEARRMANQHAGLPQVPSNSVSSSRKRNDDDNDDDTPDNNSGGGGGGNGKGGQVLLA